MDTNLKLVVFDLNKTLINENSWFDLNLAMGVTEEEDAELQRLYRTGQITYEEGQQRLGDLYLSRGKATKQKAEEALAHYTYTPGAKEIVEYLRAKGYKLALLSGAIDILVERVAKELQIEHWGAHNKLVFDTAGAFVRIDCYGDDTDFKLAEFLKICRSMNIKPTDTVCVGDGMNDSLLFDACRHGVTFMKSEIAEYAWKQVANLDDLRIFL